MRIVKVSALSVSDFAEIRSRGANYSIATITVDGVRLPGLHIVGTTKPNPGSDVLVVLKGSELSSLIGWQDPVSGNAVVTIPNIITFTPLIVMVMFPLFICLALAAPSYRWLWLPTLTLCALLLGLLPHVGWPGVARLLRQYSAKASTP